MNTVDLDADVVVVGAGIAGGMVAHRLGKAGIRVIVLEGGPDVTRAELHERFLSQRSLQPTALDPRPEYAPSTDPKDPNAYFVNDGPVAYNIHMTKAVGGTTWHWAGYCSRFGDDNFRMKSIFGVGVDWPIGYADLEPYYASAEREMGVSAPSVGFDADRRSVPTPMVDFEWPYLYKRLRDVLAPHGYAVETHGYARNAREYDGRPACRGNNTCWPLCPIGAQYNGIVHIDKARSLGVDVRPQSLVTHLEVDSNRVATTAVYRRPDGTIGQIKARAFVVAANGLETPKILLASANEQMPTGVANASDQVGRNLMDHPVVLNDIVSREPFFPGRGPVSFGWLRDLDDDRHNRAAASLGFENRMSVDEITGKVLRDGFKGDSLDREVRFRALRSFKIVSGVEMMPDPERRITLDLQHRDSAGQPRMRINFQIDEYTRRGMDYAAAVQMDVMGKIGILEHRTNTSYFGSHPAGAARMGHDPGTSVVDAQCRAHDHPNLWVASSAVFPTSGGPESPTLTIAALALRTADSILEHLKRS